MQDNKEKQNIQQNKTENSETLLFKIGRLAGKVYFGLKKRKKTTDKKPSVKKKQPAPKEKETSVSENFKKVKSEMGKKAAERKNKKDKAEISSFTRMINSNKATKLFAFCFAFLFVLFSAALLYVYRPFPVNDGIPSKVTLYYVFNGKKESKDVNGGKVFRDNGEIYVNMTDIYAGLGMSVIGDLNEMKYTLSNGEYMILTNQSEQVDMNGATVMLPGRIYIEGQNVYAPVALLQYYTCGVSIIYNTEQERLTVSRIVDDEKSNSIQTVYMDFDFLLNENPPLAPITEPEI